VAGVVTDLDAAIRAKLDQQRDTMTLDDMFVSDITGNWQDALLAVLGLHRSQPKPLGLPGSSVAVPDRAGHRQGTGDRDVSDSYASVPITIPDDHPLLAGQTFAAWPGFNNPLIATNIATGKLYAIHTDETGQICKVEECPT
jgi:hypothetical protein